MMGARVRRTTPEDAAPAVELIFVTEGDIDAASDRAVAAGAQPVRRPERMPWGQVVGYVRDNAGVLIEMGAPHVE